MKIQFKKSDIIKASIKMRFDPKADYAKLMVGMNEEYFVNRIKELCLDATLLPSTRAIKFLEIGQIAIMGFIKSCQDRKQ